MIKSATNATFSRRCIDAHWLSHVCLFETSWAVAHQALLSMGLSQKEYWSGLPFPSPGDLPNRETEPLSPVSPALAGGFLTTEPGRDATKSLRGLYH